MCASVELHSRPRQQGPALTLRAALLVGEFREYPDGGAEDRDRHHARDEELREHEASLRTKDAHWVTGPAKLDSARYWDPEVTR